MSDQSQMPLYKTPIIIDNNPVEKCTICSQKVEEYRKKTPINLRRWYVEGCGQLCGSCYMACFNVGTTNGYEFYDNN